MGAFSAPLLVSNYDSSTLLQEVVHYFPVYTHCRLMPPVGVEAQSITRKDTSEEPEMNAKLGIPTVSNAFGLGKMGMGSLTKKQTGPIH